jgi:hypothetical protein
MGQGQSFFIKSASTLDRAATLSNEAAVYQELHSRSADCARFLPKLRDYDSQRNVLVLEMISSPFDPHRSKTAYERRMNEPLAASIGESLSIVHQSTGDAIVGESTPPWIFSVAMPRTSIFRAISAANLQVIKIIQRFQEFSALLDRLKDDWRTEALIHNDIKYDNILVERHASGDETIRIVDWELAGFGDPAWDLAGILGDYLSAWIASIPITGEDPPEQFAALAKFPLTDMQPAIGAFWRAYSSSILGAGPRLIRAIKYTAARLIQGVWESMQSSISLLGTAICQLQLSFNLLRRPEEAAVHLFGIQP